MERFSREQYNEKRDLIAHSGTVKPSYEEYLETVNWYEKGGHAKRKAVIREVQAEQDKK